MRRSIIVLALLAISCSSAPTPSPAPTCEVLPTARPTSSPTAQIATATSAALTVTQTIDGDTVVLSDGSHMRLIGIDAPEDGVCGSDQATATLASQHRLVVDLSGKEDRYGRVLGYLKTVGGNDVGLLLIDGGLAIARYDSRDGYDAHPMEQTYHDATEAATASKVGLWGTCGAIAILSVPPTIRPTAFIHPTVVTALDPRFGTCKEAKAHGYGPYYQGTDPEYYWYRDADHDGIDCE